MSAFSFDGVLSNWNTSNVTNMEQTFASARAFNQPIRNWDWNVSNVDDFSNMFNGATLMINNYNAPVTPIGDWINPYQFADKAALQTAVNLWISDKTSALATYGEINTWDVSNITDMMQLFSQTKGRGTFNSDISNWDVSNLSIMSLMFKFKFASLKNARIKYIFVMRP